MKNENEDNPPPSQKTHLNQNLVIAIIGAVATILAAVIPWALDRAAKAEPDPTSAIQATFTITAPIEATATNTVFVTATQTSTPEPPTETSTPTEEIGIYNPYLTFDFEGTFIDDTFSKGQNIYLFFDFKDPKNRNDIEVILSEVEVPGIPVDNVAYQIRDRFEPSNVKLLLTKGNLTPGKYKVDIYLNNTLDETIEFQVTP